MPYKDKEKARQRNAQWNAQWYALPENKEKKRQLNAQWNALPENKEKKRQLDAQWYALPENREKARQRNALPENKEKNRQRYATDPMYRLNKNIRCAIRASLKTNNLSKNGRHWESLVGYTLQELKLHLENQFDSYMNWDNYGSYWHIDHIIPLASLKYNDEKDENFKLIWSLGNLQPLFGPENLSKKNKILVKFYPLLFPFTS
jgi:hypothetical protein